MAEEAKIITSWWKKAGPLTFKDYRSKGGFEVLEKILSDNDPSGVIEEVEKSGLQGRGGGGFPAGIKWRLTREAVEKSNPAFFPAETNAYFICNADESEPGTYKDRIIIEKNPFLILEGMIIGAWAVGANKGIIYVNGHYKVVTEILEKAIEKLEEEGMLGDNIMGSKFSFNISIFQGAGSYICGEETALINSIEGNRGEPKLRPPYPVQEGLFGRPTLVNNVESISFIPFIIKEGAGAFKKAGGKTGSYGTKIFLLNGGVSKPGAYELPLGISISELLKIHAGGMMGNRKLKCVQVGGTSGRVYGKEDWGKPLGYCKGELPVGSGALLFIDESVDLKKLLFAWTTFFLRESCGKCTPCREGNYQLYRIASDLMKNGKMGKEDKEKVEDLIFTMHRTSFCPLGSSAINGWESVITLFPKEVFGK